MTCGCLTFIYFEYITDIKYPDISIFLFTADSMCNLSLKFRIDHTVMATSQILTCSPNAA